MTGGSRLDDPRLAVLEEGLAAYASDADDPPVADDETIRAAVSVVVRTRDHLDLLLIKRARHEGDPWSGHMALPGGRSEPRDGGLADTAMRETLEETGIDLAREGTPLGRLEVVSPSSVHLPKLTISPFVFGVPSEVEAEVASREVDAVHWVPLEELSAPEAAGTTRIELPDGSFRAFPCLDVRGEVVWGLTYRILRDLLDVV